MSTHRKDAVGVNIDVLWHIYIEWDDNDTFSWEDDIEMFQHMPLVHVLCCCSNKCWWFSYSVG